MNGFLLFPAVFSFLTVWGIVSDFSVLSLFFLFLWSIRILCLKRPRLVALSLVMGCVAGGYAYYQIAHSQTKLDPGMDQWFVALHQETFEVDGDRLQVYGTIEESPPLQQVEEEIVVFYTLSSKEEKEQWVNGPVPEKVKISGELELPSSRRNPHQFDYAAFLKQQDIHWVLEARELEYLISGSSEGIVPVALQPKKWRSAVLSGIDQRMSGKTAEYTRMMLFADRSQTEETVMEQFRKIGVIHLLSISGLHIQFLIKGVEWMLLRTGFTRDKIPYLFLFFLPIYGTLAGWGTSVFRAVCQAWLLFAGKALSLRVHGLDAWAITLFLACLVDPYALFSVGFQLSYALSLTLLLMDTSKWMYRMPNTFVPIVTTLVLSIVSIPVLSYHFLSFLGSVQRPIFCSSRCSAG